MGALKQVDSTQSIKASTIAQANGAQIMIDMMPGTIVNKKTGKAQSKKNIILILN